MKRFHPIAVLMLVCLIAGGAAAAERMTVKMEVANIRSEASVKSATVWQVEKYHPLLIVEKKGAWYRIKDFEGDGGWIHKSLLDKTPAVIVRVRRCNVRTGPGTQYDVAFTVDKGIPFKVRQRKGRWIEVQHADGDGGWVFSSLVW